MGFGTFQKFLFWINEFGGKYFRRSFD